MELTGCGREQEWFLDSIDIHPKRSGNIVTLGGVQLEYDNGLRITKKMARPAKTICP